MPVPPASTPEQQQQRQALRRRLRQLRRTLSRHQQRAAARAVSRRLRALPGMSRARRLAAYAACDGELDPAPFLAWARQRGCRIYLPVIADDERVGVRFAPAPRPGRRGGWRRNRYGIPEPLGGRTLPAWKLDVLLMPLVGFDRDGHRLGMGGGYYDRLLEDLARRVRRPCCLGLAHSCQEVSALPVAAWDRDVDAVVTEQALIRPGR